MSEKSRLLNEIKIIELNPPKISAVDSQLLDNLLTIKFKMDSVLFSHCFQVSKSMKNLLDDLSIFHLQKNVSISIALWVFSNTLEITNKMLFHIICFKLDSNDKD